MRLPLEPLLRRKEEMPPLETKLAPCFPSLKEFWTEGFLKALELKG